MTTITRKLRNCSAHVTTNTNDWGITSHTLTSYSTDVAMIGLLEGEITNAYTGEIIDADGSMFLVLRAGWYDYSQTTMQHVRKFAADYWREPLTISDMRELAMNADETHVIIIDW